MEKIQGTIKLVSLATKEQEALVINLLHHLNFSVSQVTKENWLARKETDPNSIVILVIFDPNINIDQILKAISQTPNTQYLGVFSPTVSSQINPIFHACSDCCRWPCDERELHFRIQRLAQNKNDLPNFYDNGSDGKTWDELNLVGQSPLFLKTLSMIKKSAYCDAPLLIEGETGCGKGVAAKAVHDLSRRNEFPFIPINCGAIPDYLIENELFGHEKGAYTDAREAQTGITEQANGGTLFLDEIEVLSNKGQVTLLRFIEDNIVRPLGSKRSRKVNVRIIAASNVSLANLVAQNKFRQDLLFRLNILCLKLPPLRNRVSDIQCLTEYFLGKYREKYKLYGKRISPETIAWMKSYHWPGNIRELENFVHRSFLLSEDEVLSHFDISSNDLSSRSRRKLFDRRQNFMFDASFKEAKSNAINTFEEQYLIWVISHTNGNVTQAAYIAKKDRRSLGKLLKKHNIDPAIYRCHNRATHRIQLVI